MAMSTNKKLLPLSEANPTSVCQNNRYIQKTDCLVHFMGWWNHWSVPFKMMKASNVIVNGDRARARPQKIVIKGLPISADIDDIKQDLSEQGFLVSKVAQLTKK
ncbi:hypothetical protein TNCV_2798351 [Trichonephila clavipes]|nr:hypothetical protein TNCV_2798351 [Trichonephila clavipes]